jgi:hypothetical protein
VARGDAPELIVAWQAISGSVCGDNVAPEILWPATSAALHRTDRRVGVSEYFSQSLLDVRPHTVHLPKLLSAITATSAQPGSMKVCQQER